MTACSRYILLLISCVAIDAAAQKLAANNKTIIVKEPAKYSKRFIDGLREFGPGTRFELIGDTIITDGTYKASFAQMLNESKISLRGQRLEKLTSLHSLCLDPNQMKMRRGEDTFALSTLQFQKNAFSRFEWES